MTCPDCHGSGEIVVSGTSVNPFSGVPVHDPQMEDIVPCPRCNRTRPTSNTAGGKVQIELLIGRIQTDTYRRAA